jgi:hypothetical protein
MAATVLQAFRDLYASATGLPTLRTAKIPEGEAGTFPNAKMIHRGTDPRYQKGGIAYETARVRFQLWYTNFDDADTAATALMAEMTPEALVVAGKTPILFIERYLLVEEIQRGAQAEYVYRADIDCRAEVE